MSLSQTLSGMTGAEALRLKPMRVPGALKQKTFNSNPGGSKKTPPPPGSKKPTALNPYDAFTVANPYDPKTIDQTAQSGYDTDVANAQKTAALGYLTPAQIDAQAQSRAAQQTALGGSLSAALQGIQQSYVGQGNAAAAGLAGQNAATAAGSDRVMAQSGAAPVAPPDISALLGTQTASGANIYGANAAAALSSGDQNARAALAAGETLKQTNAVDQARGLSAVLANIASTSSRKATMVGENSKAQAANKATDLSIWTGIENRRLQAAAMGDKKAEAAAALAERSLEAGMSDQTRRDLGQLSADTSTGNAALAAKTSTSNAALTAKTSTANAKLAAKSRKDAAAAKAAAKTRGGLTASQRASLGRDVAKIIGSQGGVTVPTTQVDSYKVQLVPKAGTRAELTNPKGYTLYPDAATAKGLKVGGTYGGSQYKDYVIAASAPAKTTKSTTVKDAPSAWTKYTRALGRVMTVTGKDRTTAVAYLSQMGYKPPKSPGK